MEGLELGQAGFWRLGKIWGKKNRIRMNVCGASPRDGRGFVLSVGKVDRGGAC